MLNRRDLVKGLGAVAFSFLFLSRRRAADAANAAVDELLTEEQAEAEAAELGQALESPCVVEITVTPQTAFRPERLVISARKIGTRMVPVTEWKPCAQCEWAPDPDSPVDDFDDGAHGCTACNFEGGEYVATGELREEPVMFVPWVVEDFRINAQPQLAGEIPGDIFSSTAMDTRMTLASAAPGAEIRLRVRYVGDLPEGEVFYATLIGSECAKREQTLDEIGAALARGDFASSLGAAPRRCVLPICSTVKIGGRRAAQAA